jgi:hypothetical protein
MLERQYMEFHFSDLCYLQYLITHFYMRWIMLKLLKTLLKKTKEQYAALVYDRSTLSEIDDPVIHSYNKR